MVVESLCISDDALGHVTGQANCLLMLVDLLLVLTVGQAWRLVLLLDQLTEVAGLKDLVGRLLRVVKWLEFLFGEIAAREEEQVT